MTASHADILLGSELGNSLKILAAEKSYDAGSKVMDVDITLLNTPPPTPPIRRERGGVIFGPLSLVVKPVGEGMRVLDPDGLTNEGYPYFRVLDHTQQLPQGQQISYKLRLGKSTPGLLPADLLLTAFGLLQQNTPPIASVSSRQGRRTADITFSGTASYDTDGNRLSYRWELIEKPAGSFSTMLDGTKPISHVVPDKIGTYGVQLVVHDGIEASVPVKDFINVRRVTSNKPPIANAGPDRTGNVGTLVSLDGNGSSDPEGASLTYAWTLVTRPAGSAALLTGADTASTGFTPDKAGNYLAQLIVNDGSLASAPDTVSITVTSTNQAPTANAGPDRTGTVGTPVSLDGSGSSDPEGKPLSYAWTLVTRPAGSAAVLTGADSATPSFTPDQAGNYVAQLIVNDGSLASAPDTVSITVTAQNQAPTANAGPDRTGTVGTPVSLDGSGSSDPEGKPLSYAWTLVTRPAGSAAVLTGADSATPSFTPDQAGNYVAQLIVNDGSLASAPDTVSITVTAQNQAPTANAGPDRTGTVGTPVSLDGSGSSDPEGKPLSYAWTLVTRPAGSAAVLTGADTATPGFTPDKAGNYLAQLIVNDGSLASAPDTVSITVTGANQAPTANAGADRSGTVGTPVTLDGSGSSDPEGKPLTFAWTLVTRPSGSSTLLTGADTATPGFTPDQAGSYVAQLIVNDGSLASAPDTASITVNSANKVFPPIVMEISLMEFAGREGHEGFFPMNSLPIAGNKAIVRARLDGAGRELKLRVKNVYGENLAETALIRPLMGLQDEYYGEITVPDEPFSMTVAGFDMAANAFDIGPMEMLPEGLDSISPVSVTQLSDPKATGVSQVGLQIMPTTLVIKTGESIKFSIEVRTGNNEGDYTLKLSSNTGGTFLPDIKTIMLSPRSYIREEFTYIETGDINQDDGIITITAKLSELKSGKVVNQDKLEITKN